MSQLLTQKQVQTSLKTKVLQIGVLAHRGMSQALQMWEPTAQYLNNQLPEYTFKVTPLNFEQIYIKAAINKLDFVVTDSSVYVELETLYQFNRLATLKNLRMDKAYTLFGGVILRRSDRHDIQNLPDLVGKKFAGTNEHSLGAWQAAWREIKAAGINPYRDFLSLQFMGTHDAVVYAVRDGLVDAATIRTDALERMAAEGKINLEEFEIINQQTQYVREFPFALSTRLYPEWAFAASRQVEQNLVERVAIALLQISLLDPNAALAALSQGWTVPLNYGPVHECQKELNLGAYAGKNHINFDLAIKGSDDGLWDWNIETNEMFFSTRWKQMLGYAEHEITNHCQEWEQRVHPDDLEQVKLNIYNYLQGNISEYTKEYRLRHKDGSYLWILSRGILLRDVHGTPYQMAGSHSDITNRKLAESALRESEASLKEKTLNLKNTLRKLQQTQAKLIQTEKMSSLGQLVAGIANEINNPVSFIHGNVNHALEYITNIIDLLNLYRHHHSQYHLEIDQKSQEIDLEFILIDLPKLLK